MNTTILSDGIANWERLKAAVAEAKASDPTLARRSSRYASALERRQSASLSAIRANTHTPAFADYIRLVSK